MHIPDIIIAIDGYSSTGKSSFAKIVANEFSFLYLDSGALYRGVTLFAIENGFIDEDNSIDVPGLDKALENLDLHFGECGTYIGDRCIEKEIRSLAVAGKVSPIATVAEVRSFVDRKLREFGKKKRVVMDGRDIGTTVFPQAELKIFMTADPMVRAQRRAAEMEAKGDKEILEQSGAYFVHRNGELLGAGWLVGEELKLIATAKEGAGERVFHTLLSAARPERLRLEVASTNGRAIRFYEKMGLVKTAELRRWYRVF